MASLLIGGFSYHQIKIMTVATAVEGLEAESRLIASKFTDAYSSIGIDVAFIHQTPPITGILRSQTSGVDPMDGSTFALWCDRLTTIFNSLMQSKPYYTQMRYIGTADHGRELVRVDRKADTLARTPANQLQQKEGESYFAAAVKLKKGEIYYSDVTYNREYGKRDASMIPTIRVIVPVYDGESVFGFVVINVNYFELLKSIFRDIEPTRETFVINHSGDYAVYDPKAMSAHYEMKMTEGRRPSWFPRALDGRSELLVEQQEKGARERTIYEKESVLHFVEVNLNKKIKKGFIGNNNYLLVGLKESLDRLLKEARKTQSNTLILVFLVSFFSLLLAVFSARKMTSPIHRMAKAIQEADRSQSKKLVLPNGLGGEFDSLARSFNEMTANLQKSQAKYRDVLNNIVDGVVTIDSRGMIKGFNPASQKIFGYNPKEVLGHNVKMLMPEGVRENHDQYISRYVETGEKKIIGSVRELIGRRKDGSTFEMELSISETKTINEHLFTGIVRDISERRAMDKLKNEFISNISHELRTPITSIQSSLGLLEMAFQNQIDVDRQRLLEMANKNCERLTALLNDILDLEKIQAGKMEFHFEYIELIQLIQQVIDEHQSYASCYNVSYWFQPEMNEVYSCIDQHRFSQALGNLLSNAAKFSPEGGVVLVRVAFKNDGDTLTVSVANKGAGIPEEYRTHIFTKFFQADGSSTRNRDGTGLGLSITKSIVESLGGEISFESEVGVSTVFYIDLVVNKNRDGREKSQCQRH